MSKQIEHLSDLVPDDRNANKGTPRGRGLVETSLQKYGAGRSILVDRNGKVIAGNKTTDAAAAAGLDDVIVVQSDGKRLVVVQRTDLDLDTDTAARELAIADNRAGELGLEWDADVLTELSQEIDLSTFWGRDEIAALLAQDTPGSGGGGDEFDATPETGPTRTQYGELWALGRHRLLVGDSTNTTDVDRLMNGEHAALCLTDPPYGVGFEYASTDDTQANLRGLIDGFMPIARRVADVVLLTPGNSNQWDYPRPEWCLCWFVPAGTGMNKWGFTCWQPVLAYGGDPYLKAGKGSRPDGLNMTETSPDLDHPCPKPINVWMWFLERGSIKKSDLVYEPFSGSGTTLIACERTGRRCYGIEIEPRYCDVILKRWEAETGQQAERIDG